MQSTFEFDPVSVAEPGWLRSGRFDSLFVEAYEMALAPPDFPRKVFRFKKIVVVLRATALKFVELGEVKVAFGENRQIHMSAQQKVTVSDRTPKLITVQPRDSAKLDGDRHLAERSFEYVSLLSCNSHRNIAFRRLFSQALSFDRSTIQAQGETFRLPFDLPRPDLSRQALERFTRCEQQIARLDEALQQKVRLSLHWHLKGIQSDGLDCFLALWIALETLTMTSANIADINDKLASIYFMTRSAAAVEFGLGRICGLRSRVVHNGERRVISTNLTDYMECLYADLLIFSLLGERLGRARNYLQSKNLDVHALTV